MRHKMKYNFFIIFVFIIFVVLSQGCQKKATRETAEEKISATQVKFDLPPAVAQVVNNYFKDAEIEFVETEKIDGLNVYDIEFKENRGEIEVAEDGTVIDISSIITWDELPQGVAETIKKVLDETGANLIRLEKAEVRAEIKENEGKKEIIKLSSPFFLFEAELKRNSQTGEVQVDEKGQITEGPKWEEKEN